MKLIKCSNGHFYDAEKYSTCPHCSGGSGEDQPTDVYSRGMSPAGLGGGQGIGQQMGGQFGGDEGKTVGFMDQAYNQPQRVTPAPGNTPISPSPMGRRAPQSAGNDEGKTVGYMAWGTAPQKAGENDVTQNYQAPQSTQPVVGWLVCIDGSSYGSSFNLYCGKNFIGRSADMDICLASDNTVSRVRHAIIIYEPKERAFFAQPGESHELFYLNDSVVLSNTRLKDRDVITIGKTVMVFVPFCDETYGWERE